MQLAHRHCYLLLLIFIVAISSGCMETRVKQSLLNEEPLLIDKEKARAIKTLIVFPKIDKNISNEELIYVAEALEASGRFKIISPNKFAQEAAKENFVIKGMTTSDRVSASKIIGEKLSADAVLFIKTKGFGYSANFASAFTTRVSNNGSNILIIREVHSGNIIWEQEQYVNMSVSGLKSPDSRKIIKTQHDPLIRNILHSF